MRNLLPLLVCAAMLAGCNVGPNYARPTTPALDGWRVQYETAAGMADVSWWHQFGDPSLDNLVEVAVRNNLDLKQAAAAVEKYLGVLKSTRSEFFPQISGTINPEARRAGDYTAKNYSASLDAYWEIDLWGRIRRASERDQAMILSSEAARRGVVLSVVSKVADGYLTLREYDRQLEIARDTEQARAKSLRLFQLRFQHGTISQVELSQQESLYETARKEIPKYDSLVRQQENALSVLLGRVPGPIPRGKALDALTPPGIPAGLPSQLLERRPDIIEAEQKLAAATADIGVAKAGYFPKLSLTGALGAASDDIGRFTASAGTWSAAAMLTGPILDFGRTAGKVKTAKAQQEQDLFAYQSTILKGFSEVEDALIKTTTGRERLAAEIRQMQSLETYSRLSKLQFEAGTIDYLQVLDAERQLFEARLATANDKAELLRAIVATYKAMGGGWVPEADHLGSMEKH